jgi:hypothetical protein
MRGEFIEEVVDCQEHAEPDYNYPNKDRAV